MADQVKKQLVSGLLWNALEKFLLQGVTFVIGLVLARLLSPSDFGLTGMLSVFFLIINTFVNSGLGTALVQKHNCTSLDYSTVFTINFVIAIIGAVILFIAAPYIADFYHEPLLTMITRVLALKVG